MVTWWTIAGFVTAFFLADTIPSSMGLTGCVLIGAVISTSLKGATELSLGTLWFVVVSSITGGLGAYYGSHTGGYLGGLCIASIPSSFLLTGIRALIFEGTLIQGVVSIGIGIAFYVLFSGKRWRNRMNLLCLIAITLLKVLTSLH